MRADSKQKREAFCVQSNNIVPQYDTISRFGNKDKSLNCAVYLIPMLTSVEELLACYEFFREESTIIDPFTKLPYYEVAGNFVDKFGVQSGFLTK